jgi:hypothetical protein
LVQGILRQKWWVETRFMARRTSHFYGNVKYITQMTTLHDRTTVQTNARISKQNRENCAIDDTSMKISTKHHYYILFLEKTAGQ